MADGNSDGERPRGERGSVRTVLGDDRTRVVLSGEVDVSVNAELTEAVAEAEAAGLPAEVDAKHVTFIDSSGVAMLARLASRTPDTLTILDPPEVLVFLLEITKIGEVVRVVHTAGARSEGDADTGSEDGGEPPDIIA